MLDDPLLLSIFRQGRFVSFDEKKSVLTLAFPKNVSFFNELLENTAQVWQKELCVLFGDQAQLVPLFNDEPTSPVAMPSGQVTSNQHEKNPPQFKAEKKSFPQKTRTFSPSPKRSFEVTINVSDKATWGKANLLLQAFPGTMTEIKGDDYA